MSRALWLEFAITVLLMGCGVTSSYNGTPGGREGVGPATKIVFTGAPSDAVAGASINPAVRVSVEDAQGNIVPTATNSISIAVGANPSSGTLSGTLTANAVAGVATFANLSINLAGTGYTLAATATSLAGASSSAFNVMPGSAVKLLFTTQPSNTAPGIAISPAVQVTIEDAFGNVSTSATNSIAMGITGGGTLVGTTSVTPSNGVATFSDLEVYLSGSGYMLTASATGLTSASSNPFSIPVGPVTYYMSPAGNDSNPGTSTSPWLSPNHALNCGDTILATPSASYNELNFVATNWGTVSCPANSNVAWVKCAVFDACKITTSSTQNGMLIGSSYWGVQGFEVTALANGDFGCFQIQPPGAVTIHHIIYANDICNGANGGGFTSYSNASVGADYIALVGNIAYNSANGAKVCSSGVSIFQPVKSDSLPGTHIFVAGNFSWANVNPIMCDGGAPTDGEGLNLDTFDGTSVQSVSPYDQQSVVTNNIFIGNGGRGFEIFKNNGGPTGATHSTIFVYQNTSWGNSTDPNQIFFPCGEFALEGTDTTTVYKNIGVTTSSASCQGGMINVYPFLIEFDGSSLSVHDNVAFGASGPNYVITNNEGFSIGSNPLFGTDPQFANPVVPPAPSCGAASSVPNCMATVITDFTPANSAVAGYGYQVPPAGNVTDPMFPAWLCNVNLPAGLVAKSCAQ